MVWFIITHIFSTILSLIQVSRLSDKDKDMEIIILRHQFDTKSKVRESFGELFENES